MRADAPRTPPHDGAVAQERIRGCEELVERQRESPLEANARLRWWFMRSSVPGSGVRDSRVWQDKGHRVTLINDKDEAGDGDGQGQDERVGAVAQGGP